MNKMITALIFIILGLIVIAFPLLGILPLSILTGIAVLFLGIGLILTGLSFMGESKTWGLIDVILGIIAIILGLGFIVSPALFSFMAALFIFIAGIILIIAGIIDLINKAGGTIWLGLINLVLGIIYLIVAYLIKDPLFLGILIGLWLLIVGILMLFQKE